MSLTKEELLLKKKKKELKIEKHTLAELEDILWSTEIDAEYTSDNIIKLEEEISKLKSYINKNKQA